MSIILTVEQPTSLKYSGVRMESYIQNLFAERIGGSNFGKEDVIYKFEKIKELKWKQKRNTLMWN